MKKFKSLISIIIALFTVLSLFSACAQNETAGHVSAPSSNETSSEAPTETTCEEATSSTESSDVTSTSESETETEDSSSETETALLRGENAELIEGAEKLANGVSAYFDSGDRRSFITENGNRYMKDIDV